MGAMTAQEFCQAWLCQGRIPGEDVLLPEDSDDEFRSHDHFVATQRYLLTAWCQQHYERQAYVHVHVHVLCLCLCVCVCLFVCHYRLVSAGDCAEESGPGLIQPGVPEALAPVSGLLFLAACLLPLVLLAGFLSWSIRL